MIVEEEKGSVPSTHSENIQFQVRASSQRMEEYYDKLFKNISEQKTSVNQFSSVFRLFKKAASAQLGFPDVSMLRRHYGKVIGSLYIFKLYYPHSDGYTHALYLKVNGYVSRKLLDSFVQESLIVLTEGTCQVLAAHPRMKKSVSLYDYIQGLYISPENLLINFSHKKDTLAESSDVRLDYEVVSRLKSRIIQITSQIFDNMLALPDRYPNSHISQVMRFTTPQFRKYMRTTDLPSITNKVAQDAFNLAVQDYQFKPQDVQELLEPLTRKSLIQRCVRYENTKAIQVLFQDKFSLSFVHPHPLSRISKRELHQLKPLDGMIFDCRFLLPLLMTSRWLMRATMREQDSMTNNQAHLLLYGGAGTGKSLILSAISSSISTYKYLANSRFQNPDLLESSFFQLEEFETIHLASNQYKQLLDIKGPVKIDFKNLHPENVSEGVACMITSNDEVLSLLRTQKRYNSVSVDAALRRLYLIPLKMGKFDKLHGRLPEEHPAAEELTKHETKYMSEPNKLERLFNFMMSFAMFQQDIPNIAIDSSIVGYLDKIQKEFVNTVFGTFYLFYKQRIDALLAGIENIMVTPDINDTEYLSHVGVATGQLQQLIQTFLVESNPVGSKVRSEFIKDPTIPQPIKYYHLRECPRYAAQMMWKIVADPSSHLNGEVLRILKNPDQPYVEDISSVSTPPEEPVYGPTSQEDFGGYSYLSPRPVPAEDIVEQVLPMKRVRSQMSELYDLPTPKRLSPLFDVTEYY